MVLRRAVGERGTSGASTGPSLLGRSDLVAVGAEEAAVTLPGVERASAWAG
jgi:hypothetical protein